MARGYRHSLAEDQAEINILIASTCTNTNEEHKRERQAPNTCERQAPKVGKQNSKHLCKICDRKNKE
jgi:hypothetical protein